MIGTHRVSPPKGHERGRKAFNFKAVARDYVRKVFEGRLSPRQENHAIECLLAFIGQTGRDMLFPGAPLPPPIRELVEEGKVSRTDLLRKMVDQKFEPRLCVRERSKVLRLESVVPPGGPQDPTVDLHKLLGDEAVARILGRLMKEWHRPPAKRLNLFAKGELTPEQLTRWKELHSRRP